MATRADAPAAGWYPDPEGGSRLRWWDGTDWTAHYRPRPTEAELLRLRAATPVRSEPLGGAVAPAGERRALARSEVETIVAEVRQAARSEVERAADLFTQRARSATRELQPLVSEYTNRILRWLRIALVVLVVLVIAWFVFEAVAKATFFDWLGERIDRLTE